MSKEVTGQRERGLGFGSTTIDHHCSYSFFLEYLFVYVLYAHGTISRDYMVFVVFFIIFTGE